jgi:MFS family permease
MSIPARPIMGYLADNVLGPINTFIIGLFALSIMVYCWIGVTSAAGMYVFCVFFGFVNGACQGTFVGANASLTKVSHTYKMKHTNMTNGRVGPS